MCAILDANVVHEVFSDNRPAAGTAFFNRISSGNLRLVVGGKLLDELGQNSNFQAWLQQAALAGIVRTVNDQAIAAQCAVLRRSGSCRSNDLHVIALAQLSRARLLYSNDRPLHQDFTDPTLINQPRGKVYSTRTGGQLQRPHQQLLRRNVCR